MYGSYKELVAAVKAGEVDFHECRRYLSSLTGIENPGYPDFSREHERHIIDGTDPFTEGLPEEPDEELEEHVWLQMPKSGGSACVVVGLGSDSGSIEPKTAYRFRDMAGARGWLIERTIHGRGKFISTDAIVDDHGLVHVAVPLGAPPGAASGKGGASRRTRRKAFRRDPGLPSCVVREVAEPNP